MKKISKVVLSVCLALACVFSFAACNEGAPQKTAGMGTAIYGKVGHAGCVAEATVIVDGYGQPIKVTLDDIFPLKDVCKYAALAPDAPKVGDYYQYIQIGDAVFEADANGKYNQIGVENGITDFEAYYNSPDSDAGIKMYYNAFIDKKLNVLTPSDASNTEAVQLAGAYYTAKAFNTDQGSMRKRYSKYWKGDMLYGSYLGFVGNMEMLENYLLTYGFKALEGNIENAVQNVNGYQTIDGITTGATAVHSYMYLEAAYNAYKLALENQKAL